MDFEAIFRYLIPLLIGIGIVWIFQMLKKLPEDPQKPYPDNKGVDGDDNWYESQTEPTLQDLVLQESKTSMEDPALSPPPKPEAKPADSISTGIGIETRLGKRSQRVKLIAGIPLNAKSFYQGVVLSEILKPPKSKRRQLRG